MFHCAIEVFDKGFFEAPIANTVSDFFFLFCLIFSFSIVLLYEILVRWRLLEILCSLEM